MWLIVLSFALTLSPASSSCIDGQKESLPHTCTSYLLCHDGTWSGLSCGSNERFDPNTKSCADWEKVPCKENIDEGLVLGIHEDRTCEGFWKRPVKEDCQKYIECSYGVPYIKSCPVLMRFDHSKLECRLKWLADCTFKPECIDGQNRALFYSCTGYETCDDGFWKRRECKFPLSFEHRTLSCRDSHKAQCLPSNCTFRYQTRRDNCRYYDECIDGNYVERKCPLLHTFDTVWHICRWEWSAITDCGISNSGPPTVQTQKLSTPKEFCPDGKAIPVPKSCKKYIACDPDTGVRSNKKCRMCQNFDPKKLKCVWQWQYECSDNPTEAPECQKGEKVPVNCKNYKKCNNGKWQNKTCPWGQHFDINKLECRFAWWAKC